MLTDFDSESLSNCNGIKLSFPHTESEQALTEDLYDVVAFFVFKKVLQKLLLVTKKLLLCRKKSSAKTR